MQNTFKKKINRNSILISLGGGTLGDLTGFVKHNT